ncbi:MAG: hypothetical protein M1833_001477 [Piccolia ochrophora]|nr:MAG: hypothetical protein M1833_001477 [Piccolia ochrophora]
MAAALSMLDERHGDTLIQDNADPNNYSFGRIGNHNVVIACLPAGICGTVSAATLASQMLRSFKSIKIGLMVGIGGGVPTADTDIRLGDVVVSKPKDRFGGVVQYDLGKKTRGGKFERTGSLDKPPTVLLNALSAMQAESMVQDSQLGNLLNESLRKTPKMLANFSRPQEKDELYQAGYDHFDNSRECIKCDRGKLVMRSKRSSFLEPEIHHGTIASGNLVIKNAAERDKLSKDLGGILCFEMEAAGLMDHFPCLVIRGICDYADSHKNKRWQNYAAAVAAAYAKKLLTIIPSGEVEKTAAAHQIVSPYGQLSPAIGPSQLQQPFPHFNQLLPESQSPSSQQRAIADRLTPGFDQMIQQQRAVPDQSTHGFGQMIPQQRAIADRLTPGFDQMIQQQRAIPDQSTPGFGQMISQQRAVPDQSTRGFGQMIPQQRAFPSNQSRPGIGQRSAYSSPMTNQLSVGVAHSNRPQPSKTLDLVGHSAPDLRGHGVDSRPTGRIQGKIISSQAEERAGYRQASRMVYPQPPRMSHPRHPRQPVDDQVGSSIPNVSLPGPQREPKRPKALGVVHSTKGHYRAPPVAAVTAIGPTRPPNKAPNRQGQFRAPKRDHRGAKADPDVELLPYPVDEPAMDDHSDISSTESQGNDKIPEGDAASEGLENDSEQNGETTNEGFDEDYNPEAENRWQGGEASEYYRGEDYGTNLENGEDPYASTPNPYGGRACEERENDVVAEHSDQYGAGDDWETPGDSRSLPSRDDEKEEETECGWGGLCCCSDGDGDDDDDDDDKDNSKDDDCKCVVM